MFPATLLAALACADGPAAGWDPNPAAPSQQSAPVIGGDPSPNLDAVGALVNTNEGGWRPFCSATLVAPDWVLTAAHCAEGGAFDGLRFCVGEDATRADACTPYAVQQAVVHPLWVGGFDLDNDIALMRLATPLVGITPLLLASSEPVEGQNVTMVGYGADEVLSDNTTLGIGRRREGDTSVFVVRPAEYVVLSNARGQLVCRGDSGGPDLSVVGGQRVIVGVHSSVAFGDCVDSSARSIRADVYVPWVEETLGRTVAGPHPADAGSADAAAEDAGAEDAGAEDAGAADAGAEDAGAADAGAEDAGAGDAGIADAGAGDAGIADAGASDAGTPPASGFDAGSSPGPGALDDAGPSGSPVPGADDAPSCSCAAVPAARFPMVLAAALAWLARSFSIRRHRRGPPLAIPASHP